MAAQKIEAALKTLGGRRLSDGTAMVLCPAHADKNPSLHLTPGDNGRLLVSCQAGCSQDAVIEALKARDLWPKKNGHKSSTANLPPGIPDKWHGAEYAAHWTYYDQQGKALGHVARYEGAEGKQVIPFFKPNGAGWKAGAAQEPRPLYNLHKLSRNPEKPVLIVEGEKATDAAERITRGAYVCMTWPGGSNVPGKADFNLLEGRTVFIWPDADEPGRKAALIVADRCRKAGARSVIVVKLPESVKTGWDLADAEAEGWTGQQALEHIVNLSAQDEQVAQPAFRFIQVADLKIRAPEWLVRLLVETDSLVEIFGDPGCGKSFIGIDIACCVASGKDFHGNAVKQGAALYIAGEGQNGITRRLKAWQIRHQINLSFAPLFVSTAPASFCDAESAAQVQKAIEATGTKPALVVVDTLARNFGPGDENSTQDMSQFISALDQIRTRHRCAILLIHHSGHGDKTRSRGAMALKGALDAEYRMIKDERGIVRLENTKMKDFEPPEPMAFEIRTVELGLEDEDGEPVTSAILDRVDYEPTSRKGNAGRGKKQAEALKILDDLYHEHRENLEKSGFDPESARVLIADWRDRCYQADMAKQTWHNCKKSLLEQGLIYLDHDYVSRSHEA